MRTVIQRVQRASVSVEGIEFLDFRPIPDGKASKAIAADTEEDAQWLCRKVLGLRIFDDEAGVMNRSIMDIDGEIIVVSQFTLFASYKKGNRPSWLRAAGHEHAVPMYERFVELLSQGLGKKVGTGVFGAEMKVELINDGPVTICMDTKNKE